ncbi:ectonucleotide pyrophosphatase/phosphodiesterase [Anaeramoeba flamelloides]|uniref:Ectonucleotide pyrophosphatase/phosphodiesterase n=1 Tax=Anaeramoeba flamelloides TaxID=1746091 RepID=A0ABQ8YB15_9EUKA|nr:ectonucleotide pyrophosphatase/phosphodiesterase [Anaeramoeba flamelloides]
MMAKQKTQSLKVIIAVILVCIFLITFSGIFLFMNFKEEQFVGAINEDIDMSQSVLIISIDAFRHDYFECAEAPNLKGMSDQIHIQKLIPPFPSKTFVSHYSQITGLYPAWSGIVANTMYDSEQNLTFSIGSSSSQESFWWWGEPFWISNQREGHLSGTVFWVASEVGIYGRNESPTYPTYYLSYDRDVTYKARIDQFFDWLDLPEAIRPNFYTLYFESVDDMGHMYGPCSKEVTEAIEDVDNWIGYLIRGLEARGLWKAPNGLNVIVDSDHGMTKTSKDKVIIIDDYIQIETSLIHCAHMEHLHLYPSLKDDFRYNDLDCQKRNSQLFHDDSRQNKKRFQKNLNQNSPSQDYEAQVVNFSPVTQIIPAEGKEEQVYQKLVNASQNWTVYKKEDVPSKYHYSWEGNSRIKPIIIVLDLGWSISDRAYYEKYPDNFNGGNHGYANDHDDMAGFFVASGPAFVQENNSIEKLENLEIYQILQKIVGLKNPAPNNGTMKNVESLFQ